MWAPVAIDASPSGDARGREPARAAAYHRVVRTIRDLGPAKLWAKEQACIREAANTLLFCTDLGRDGVAQAALAAIATLSDDLIDAERWAPEPAERLLEAVWACGQGNLLDVPLAA
jgi:hypothetical protein